MIKPLKHKPINWINGMKLSSNHFVSNDLYVQDLVRNSHSLHLNSSNYGLLPPFIGHDSSHNIDIIEKASGNLEVIVKYCNAITADGCHIDISQSEQIEPLKYQHNFSNAVDGYYSILLVVHLFERLPFGIPDSTENPIRYPELTKKYTIEILPDEEINAYAEDHYFLTIGQVFVENGTVKINKRYISPSTTLTSHPALITYYEKFSSQLNDLQLATFKIIDKTSAKDQVSIIGKNVRVISIKMADYISYIFYDYRNIAYKESPIHLVGYFSNLAHVFFTALKLIEPREREELLKYFYEWRDVTPGNFEELLAKTIDINYDHKNIFDSMQMVSEFNTVILALWNKLSDLEYVGQRKENIVVAEQEVIQQVSTKKSWTLLD